MHGNKSGCGHKWHGKGVKVDWDKDYEKMSPEEKKEVLGKKAEHLKEKMKWVEDEMGKLNQ